jgi:hypothetical protein
MLLTSKFTYGLLFLFIAGCASSDFSLFSKEELEKSVDAINKDNEADSLSFGPTLAGLDKAFLDKTSEYGLNDITAANLNVIDFNEDGFSDLVILPDYFSTPIFYQFNPKTNKFEKVESGFKTNIRASYLLFYDITNNGILDAVVGVLNQKSELTKVPIKIFYGKREKGRIYFEEQKNLLPFKANATASVSLVDYNLDGKLDLFMGNWLGTQPKGTLPVHDYLFENKNNKFVDISSQLEGETDQNPEKTMYPNATPTYGVSICDVDQNGYPDILTTSTNQYPNKLWMNEYDFRLKKRIYKNHGKFSQYSDDMEGQNTQRGGGRTFFSACTDYNNDGIVDVFMGEISHNYDHDSIDRSSILTGTRFKYPPVFLRTEYLSDSHNPNWHQSDRRGVWFDYDNDGHIDLLVDNSGFPPDSRLILFKQFPDHSFENVSKSLGLDIVNPQSSVILDLNKDGRMDIITTQSNLRNSHIKNRVYVFENNVPYNKNRSIRFYLQGTQANRQALGASVILKVQKGRDLIRKIQVVDYSQGGLPPQNEEGMHYGVGANESVVSVSVRWPYSDSLNQKTAGIERLYKIPNDFTKTIEITLCESGDFFVGRKVACP